MRISRFPPLGSVPKDAHPKWVLNTLFLLVMISFPAWGRMVAQSCVPSVLVAVGSRVLIPASRIWDKQAAPQPHPQLVLSLHQLPALSFLLSLHAFDMTHVVPLLLLIWD